MRHGIDADENRASELAERDALTSPLVEVRGIEPLLERAIERRPLGVDRRVPGRIAVATLVDARLPEDALVRQAEALRGGARTRVQRVALPLVSAIAERE